MISAMIAALVAAAASHFSGFGTMQMTIGAAVVVFILVNRSTAEARPTPPPTPPTPTPPKPPPTPPRTPPPKGKERNPYPLATTPGSPAKIRFIAEETCDNLKKQGINTEAQLFGKLLGRLGGSNTKDEADQKFEEFIEFLKTQGVPGKNARRAAEDMRAKCEDGLVLDEVRQNKALTSSEMWTTTKITATRQQNQVDGKYNFHLGHKRPATERLLGLGETTTKKHEGNMNNGYSVCAFFLNMLDGKTSVKESIMATTGEVGTAYNDTIGHQVMLEFQHGTNTQSSKLFHARA